MPVEARWFDLDADLGLHARFWGEKLPGDKICTDDRVVARRIGYIGCYPEFGIIDQTRSAAESTVVTAQAGSKAVVVQGIHPIVSSAEYQAQTAKLELILRIHADLLLRDRLIGKHRPRKPLRNAINRVQQIKWRPREIESLQITDLVALEINTDQRLVEHRPVAKRYSNWLSRLP